MSDVLIHIGFPKSGSTYLQNWFQAHPAFYYQPKAIAGFYNAHDIARYAQHTDKIHSWFVLSSEDLSVWKGDVDVVGFKGRPYNIRQYHKNLTTTLQKVFPTAKILIVTRGYSSMLKSLYSQYIKGGGFLTFLQLQENYGPYFIELYDYSWIVDLYRKSFGKENVILLPYELLRESPYSFTSIIEKALGIESGFSYTEAVVNPSLSSKSLAASRIVSKGIYELIQPLPASWQKKIYSFHINYLLFKGNHPLVKFAEYFIQQGEELKVKEDLLIALKQKAHILHNEELYQPFLKEYLI